MITKFLGSIDSSTPKRAFLAQPINDVEFRRFTPINWLMFGLSNYFPSLSLALYLTVSTIPMVECKI